ncbi:hypothetical protein NDQ53_14385 [Rossellomorea marisflavi]|uniref:hypothetical protein n=1 Tax=Rossellomorea marisflavi TaxID=189381 RepID=UPI00203D102F|nr:hypothetical protein [Rossellomorea marisflavi]MCM2590487.1 hypothetical protein [Rossellomorea marisflavi]
MGLAKDQLIKQQDKGSHLERCMKCNTVLRTFEERDTAICGECIQRAIDKD